MSTTRRGRLAVGAAILLAVLDARPALAQEQKHVLVLWGGRPDLPINTAVNQEIRSALHAEFGPEVDLRFEYVEANADPAEQLPLRDFLARKYASGRFDLLVAIASSSIHFARAYAGELFPGVPILCWGPLRAIEDWGPGPPFTAVVFRHDAAATVDFMLKAQPGTSRLVVITGASPYDDPSLEANARQVLRRYQDRLTVTYLRGHPLEDVRARVTSLPDRTAILYLSMHGDGAGRRLVNVEAMSAIARSANAPTYVLMASLLGTGAVGGVVGDQHAMAREAGEVAVRVLRGTDVRDIPIRQVSQVPMVDWRQLRRWGIDEGNLPRATAVLFREPSVWEEHRGRILAFLALCLGQAVLISALLIQRRRRRRAESLSSAVLASLHDHVAVLDRAGTVVEVNPSWRRFASENGPALASHPLPPANCLAAWDAAADGAGAFGARARAGLTAVLAGTQPRFRLEHACPAASGTRWLEMSVEPLRTPAGGAVVTHTDVTARRDAERLEQEQRRQLAHLGRVAMLGELTGTLAHELNQPLTTILSAAQAARHVLAMPTPDLAELRDCVDDILSADRRAGDVIASLRRMLRRTETRLQPVDINEVVREVIALAHGDFVARGVEVVVQLADGLPPVAADRVQLQQVLLNLILNGCDAMANGPTAQKELTVSSAREADGRVVVRVRDRGTGIPSDSVDRIFEPFFTSKREGIGLGLAICRTIASAHGGQLWATNNDPGRGATLHLTLPCSQEEASPPSSVAV
jgi:C4-dicarboxylate-specific signal transduction histidine kinase